MLSETPLHVLVVEDDPSLGRALTRGLVLAGHSLRSLQTCGAARQLAERFDCAVLDMDLPDGKGVDLAGELLRAGYVQQVVFFTASSERSLLRRAKQFGPIVAKSQGVAELVSTLNSCASARQSERAVCTNLVMTN